MPARGDGEKKKAFKKVYSLETRVFFFFFLKKGKYASRAGIWVFSPPSAFSPHLGNVYLLCCLFRAKNASGVGKLGCVRAQGFHVAVLGGGVGRGHRKDGCALLRPGWRHSCCAFSGGEIRL